MNPVPRLTPACVGGALLALACSTACADAVGVANAVRVRGCDANPGVAPALRRNSSLDALARELAHGHDLAHALAASGYQSKALTTLRFEGDYSERAFAMALAARICHALTDPANNDVGTFGGPAGVWIVVARGAGLAPIHVAARGARDGARPLTHQGNPRAHGDDVALERELLERINDARAMARRCGNKVFAAVPPLRFDPTLERVAAEHSEDMAVHREFDHVGHDGSTPAARVRRTGLAGRLIGENIAFGAMSASDAVAGWLASPGHCENIMDARFTETGIAVADARGRAGSYFTEVFVQPAAVRAVAAR